MYEIIERVNLLAGPKPKSFLCKSTMVVTHPCNLEFFRTEEVSTNKVTSKNISTITNKQKASWGNILGFFHLGTSKSAF